MNWLSLVYCYTDAKLTNCVNLFNICFVLQSPNLVGCPLGLLQLVLYCMYRKKGIVEEPMKRDPEKNDDKAKQLQAVNDDNTINVKY